MVSFHWSEGEGAEEPAGGEGRADGSRGRRGRSRGHHRCRLQDLEAQKVGARK